MAGIAQSTGLVVSTSSNAEAACSFGLVGSALRRCVSQLQQERGGITPTSKVLTPVWQ